MIQAGYHRVAVAPSDLKPGEKERPSGLIVQEEHHDQLCRGIIVNVGPEAPPELQPGMTIFYSNGLKVEGVEIVAITHVFAWTVDE